MIRDGFFNVMDVYIILAMTLLECHIHSMKSGDKGNLLFEQYPFYVEEYIVSNFDDQNA